MCGRERKEGWGGEGGSGVARIKTRGREARIEKTGEKDKGERRGEPEYSDEVKEK